METVTEPDTRFEEMASRVEKLTEDLVLTLWTEVGLTVAPGYST
jgi:hypothetical protein